VDRPNVFLLTLKRAENGDGIIVRLIETEGQAVTVSLTLPLLTVEKALRTNLAEENEDEVASAPHQITVPIHPFQTVTIRVRPQRDGQ
jgi:alpha-mannosidase